MAIKKFDFAESNNQTQQHIIHVPKMVSINKVTVNTGNVTIDKVEGDKITVTVRSGAYTRRVQTGGSYTPGDSKTATQTLRLYKTEDPPNTVYYSSGGYSGTLSQTGYRVDGFTDYWIYNYSGTVTKPASDTRTYAYYYQYEVTVDYVDNSLPFITDNTENNKIFYEQDEISLKGSVTDADNGNIMSVKYKINNGTTRAIATAISDGTTPIAYSKTLKYTNGKLFDVTTEVATGLVDGQTYAIVIWAEDDQGGKSAEVVKNFTVVPNRPPKIMLNPIEPQTDKINSESLTLSGEVTDPENNDVVVSLRINENNSKQIYSGVPSTFTTDIKISDLKEENNTLTLTAKDTFNFVTTKTVTIKKTRNATKLKQAIARYKVNPPSRSAKQILAWIQREIGDLTVDADVSMVLAGENEVYKPMAKLTAPIDETLEEDEFSHEELEEKDNITLKLKLSKTDTLSTESIKQISGVLK